MTQALESTGTSRTGTPSSPPADALAAGPLATLRERGSVTLFGPGGRIAVFADGDAVRAVDNRCPHMGFPLDEGSVRDGILTCHWHEARFDLASGCTFDLFADDVPTHETWVVDDDVFVAPFPSRRADVDHHVRRLRSGIELDVPLVQAKSLLGLLELNAPLTRIAAEVVAFASRNTVHYGEGLVRLGCVANLYPHLREETAYLALLYAIRRVSGDAGGSPARRPRQPLGESASHAHDASTLDRWLRQWVRTRHRDGAERTLLSLFGEGGVRTGAPALLGAASERLFANTGHVLDACNKALEMIDLLAAEDAVAAEDVVPLLVRALTETRGEEESATWHHPVEIAEPLRAIEERLPRRLEAARAAEPVASETEAGLAETLLGSDPMAILTALEEALAAGLPAERLARRVAWAASMRLARFATSNEVTDWFGPQHTLNFANAAHQAVTRAVTPGTVRAVFQAAIAVYVDRYLNVPPAKLPSERGSQGDLPADAESLRSELLALLDRRGSIDDVARVASRWLQTGNELSGLVDALVYGAVREDIDFHCLQVIEASARQAAAWGPGPEQEAILVGAARNLAAHCPTRRAGQQTANIALRLHRGDRVFADEGA